MNRLLPLAFWCAAAFALVMALLPHPPEIPGDPSDKIQHIAAFATLALLGTRAYPRLSPIKLALALCAFGALIEVLQLIPSLHRDSDVRDWFADTLAVVAALSVARLSVRLRALAQPGVPPG
ncbi:MAG: VanZ family protein [Croceibacterium sp.]